MIDVQKLKYDLAMQSALAATVLNRRADESIPEQMLKDFSAAYQEYSAMNPMELSGVATGVTKSEQFSFETVNSLGKRKV